jgi:hypothetical protein
MCYNESLGGRAMSDKNLLGHIFSVDQGWVKPKKLRQPTFGPTPKTLTNLLKSHADRVDEISDERGNGDGYWIYLKPGWINPLLGAHLVHEYTVKDCMEHFKTVCKCDCEQCSD